MADKGGFPHYLLKEIFEQPKGLRDTIEPRVSLEEAVVRLDDVRISTDELRALRRINIVASGTSRHAGMAGQYMIQDLVNIPVDVDYASEFEYRNPLIGPGELTIVITQSGETADTTAAQREAKAKGSRTIAISNVVDSTIAREADGVLYTHAGPEISIASTKAFTAQMAVLYLFALYLGQVRGKFAKEQRREYIRELLDLPGKMEVLLKSAPAACEQLAEKYYKVQDFLFMGRAIHYPVAMDGRSSDVLRGLLAGGDCEIGAHHHVWETPPCTVEDIRKHPYASALPRSQFEQQLASLTNAIAAAVGVKPVTYRSGRFGFSADHVAGLERLGYLVESSVAPLFYESHKGGPEFVEAPLTPYFLAYDSATRPGTSGVLEVPVSCALDRRLPRRSRGRFCALRRRAVRRSIRCGSRAARAPARAPRRNRSGRSDTTRAARRRRARWPRSARRVDPRIAGEAGWTRTGDA